MWYALGLHVHQHWSCDMWTSEEFQGKHELEALSDGSLLL